MRKGLFFWSAFGLCFAIIALVIFLVGKEPEQRSITESIPVPEASSPYVYLEGDGASFKFDFPEELLEESGQARPFLLAVQGVSPILSFSKDSACLVAWDKNEPHLYASALFSVSVTENLKKAELPAEWKNLEERLTLSKDENNITLLTWKNGIPSLYMDVDGGLSLLSTSKEGLQLMKDVLHKTKENLDMEWKVSSDWKNHFRFYDGGLLSQLLSLDGVKVSLVPFIFNASWYKNDEKGELSWKTSGIDGVIPATLYEKLMPIQWNQRIIAPEPLLLAAGINIPDIRETEMASELVKEMPEEFPFSAEELLTLLHGPVCLTVAGNSKVIFFSLPGFVLQLPDRGTAGVKLVNEFWSQEWRMLVPSIESLEGFHTGGTASVPFTILGAARDDLAVLGIIQKSDIKVEKKINNAIPSLKNSGGAFAWGYAHGERLADALDVVARASAMADKLGSDVGINADELTKAAEELRQVGEISLMMPTIDEGSLKWTIPQDTDEESEEKTEM